jgi:hypothetical protein
MYDVTNCFACRLERETAEVHDWDVRRCARPHVLRFGLPCSCVEAHPVLLLMSFG